MKFQTQTKVKVFNLITMTNQKLIRLDIPFISIWYENKSKNATRIKIYTVI